MTGFEKSPLCESSGLGASIERISTIPLLRAVHIWLYLEACLPFSRVEQFRLQPGGWKKPFALRNKKLFLLGSNDHLNNPFKKTPVFPTS